MPSMLSLVVHSGEGLRGTILFDRQGGRTGEQEDMTTSLCGKTPRPVMPEICAASERPSRWHRRRQSFSFAPDILNMNVTTQDSIFRLLPLL